MSVVPVCWPVRLHSVSPWRTSTRRPCGSAAGGMAPLSHPDARMSGMPSYVAFLRAVNVGGRFVKMADGGRGRARRLGPAGGAGAGPRLGDARRAHGPVPPDHADQRPDRADHRADHDLARPQGGPRPRRESGAPDGLGARAGDRRHGPRPPQRDDDPHRQGHLPRDQRAGRSAERGRGRRVRRLHPRRAVPHRDGGVQCDRRRLHHEPDRRARAVRRDLARARRCATASRTTSATSR